ncbi:MAG: pyrroline-5-carboxylate reductase [Proteobacteria bacterium]|nr:pyrroline-5-carboxylate reductase [Pseudomonadota bacterium]
MSFRDLAVLGAGNMGRALISGLLRSGTRPEQLRVAESQAAARNTLRDELGITASADGSAAVSGAAVVVLAVKPQDARTLLTSLAPQLSAARPLLISVAAGIRVAQLQQWSGGLAVVRAMPNRPALLGAGASGLYAAPTVAMSQRNTAQQVMAAVGQTVWVDSEDALDVVTALSGSGPAYFFLLAEAMAAAAVQLGLPQAAAQQLARATLHGSGLMTQTDEVDLTELRRAVTSPGGTTAAALAAFEQADLRGLVARAMAAAAQRSRELAEGTGS